MRYKIPAIRRICRKIDDQLCKAVVARIAAQVLQKELSGDCDLESLYAACRDARAQLGDAKFQALAEQFANEMLEDVGSRVANRIDSEVANDIADEYFEVLEAVACGDNGPRNVNQAVVSKLIKLFDEQGKLIDWSKVVSNIGPDDLQMTHA